MDIEPASSEEELPVFNESEPEAFLAEPVVTEMLPDAAFES
jgi:hypothetical protein